MTRTTLALLVAAATVGTVGVLTGSLPLVTAALVGVLLVHVADIVHARRRLNASLADTARRLDDMRDSLNRVARARAEAVVAERATTAALVAYSNGASAEDAMRHLRAH